MAREGNLQQRCLRVVDELRMAGVPVKAVKYHSEGHGRAGTPDVHVTYRGRSSWIELKAPGEKPTDRQLIEQSEWRKAGAISTWCSTLGGFVDSLKLTKEDLEHLPKWARQ